MEPFLPSPKWPSFHIPDWFVVNCVRSLIPKDSDVLLILYDFQFYYQPYALI